MTSSPKAAPDDAAELGFSFNFCSASSSKRKNKEKKRFLDVYFSPFISMIRIRQGFNVRKINIVFRLSVTSVVFYINDDT